MRSITATRYHDFSAGHRVVGHEGKCSMLHGHNYRVHFTARPAASDRLGPSRRIVDGLDRVGRVIDFSVLASTVCAWLEEHWDHRMLLSVDDPILSPLTDTNAKGVVDGIVLVEFNPTAENMAFHLLTVVGPKLLAEHGVELCSVTVEETRKCSATATL